MKAPAPDLRVERTVKKLESALFQLIPHSDVQDISVKSLCETAGISRSTFYDYFHSVQDMLNFFTDRYVREFEKGVQKYLARSKDRREYYPWLLRYIRENKRVFQCLYAYDYRTHFIEKTDVFVERPYGDALSDGDAYYARLYAKYGAQSILKHWLANDCREPASEIAALLTAYQNRMFPEGGASPHDVQK